jgi:hypothetical protein
VPVCNAERGKPCGVRRYLIATRLLLPADCVFRPRDPRRSVFPHAVVAEVAGGAYASQTGVITRS